MSNQVPEELRAATEDLYEARRKLIKTLKEHNIELDRFIARHETAKYNRQLSPEPYISEDKVLEYIDHQIASAKQQQEKLRPMLDYFEKEASKQ